MDRQALLDGLTEDILAYVMGGSFPEDHVAEELAYPELDERFHDYEMLVRLHFVLRSDVVAFVADLPNHLRSVKTQTENVRRTTRGAVDGRINWSATVRERYARNPRDESVFVCDNRTESYDVDENIVLRRLLGLIYETLEESERYLEREYAWVDERWTGEADVVGTMEEVFRRNVHVRRIRRPEEYEPTDRMLQRAAESRQEVYREAARLLREYRRTLRGERDAIARLLEDTAITPDDDETLFELYVLFRYIGVVEGLVGDRFELRTIESGKQEVARLDGDDRSVVVYHDSAARAEDLSFVSDVSEKDASEMSRTERVQHETGRIIEEYFRDRKSKETSGRPDVIVLEIDDGDSREYLITEVKYSSRPETIERGVKETLEYLAFLRDGDELVFDETKMFGDGWNGALVVDDLHEQETAPLDDQQHIRILQASELEDDLERIVEQVLSESN